jgi:predicted hotdog family 3-hydroxylacyl-ACP dehydratase
MTPANHSTKLCANFVANPSLLNAVQIAQLIPHQGNMSLLETVNTFDAHRIDCSAVSHRNPSNPLRENNMLHAVCGVEYAAQAMALHGALSSAKSASADTTEPRGGRLASLRSVEFFVSRLDDIHENLIVSAALLMRDENNMMYEFTVSTSSVGTSQTLVQGKATVILIPVAADPKLTHL